MGLESDSEWIFFRSESELDSTKFVDSVALVERPKIQRNKQIDVR